MCVSVCVCVCVCVGGGDANLHHPLYFLQHCQGANMHYSKLFDFWYILDGCVGMGWGVAQRIQIFYSKSLITEYAIKSKDMLRFASNFNTTPILIVAIYWKSWFSKIFKFRSPHLRLAMVSRIGHCLPHFSRIQSFVRIYWSELVKNIQIWPFEAH